jgi:hypothetical protein
MTHYREFMHSLNKLFNSQSMFVVHSYLQDKLRSNIFDTPGIGGGGACSAEIIRELGEYFLYFSTKIKDKGDILSGYRHLYK